MDRKKLIKHLKGNVRLRIDNVAIDTKQGVFHGKGRLHAENGKFQLRITLNEGQQFPEKPPGIYNRSDFYPVSGIIEDHLPFRAEMPPLPGRSMQNGIVQLRTSVSSIDLDAVGWDELTHEQIQRMLEDQPNAMAEPEEAPVVASPSPSPPRAAEECECYFTGLFKGFELIAFNRQDEHGLVDKNLAKLANGKKKAYSGALGINFEYALIEKRNGLEFHLRSLPGYQSFGQEDDLKYLSAFFSTLGFVYGQHPWPFLLEFRRNGRLMLDRIRPYKTPASTKFTPFNERLFYDAIVNSRTWSLNEPMRNAFAYFAQQTSMSRWISNFLFHMRESSKGPVHAKISATVLCPLLENLIRTIAKELQLVVNGASFAAAKEKAVAALNAAKDTITDDAEKQAFERFIGRSKSMEEWDTVQYFRSVTGHFQLPWEPRWKEILRQWKEHRNLSLHTGNHDPENDYRAELQVSSRIAGATSVLILKLMGYSGQVRWSAFDDDYGVI